jgi:hypothetical protein
MVAVKVELLQCNTGDKLLEQTVDSKVSAKYIKMSLIQRRGSNE